MQGDQDLSPANAQAADRPASSEIADGRVATPHDRNQKSRNAGPSGDEPTADKRDRRSGDLPADAPASIRGLAG